jgi:hypothetical protein
MDMWEEQLKLLDPTAVSIRAQFLGCSPRSAGPTLLAREEAGGNWYHSEDFARRCSCTSTRLRGACTLRSRRGARLCAVHFVLLVRLVARTRMPQVFTWRLKNESDSGP